MTLINVLKKLAFKIKLWNMDYEWFITGKFIETLLPPSFYYTHTEEEIQDVREQARKRFYNKLDQLEKEEEQERANAERSARD